MINLLLQSTVVLSLTLGWFLALSIVICLKVLGVILSFLSGNDSLSIKSGIMIHFLRDALDSLDLPDLSEK